MKYIGGPLELTSSYLKSALVADVNTQMGLSNTARWTASGRSGLALILEHWDEQLADGWMLLPDYMCWDSVSSLFQNIKVQYVPINEQFEINSALLEKYLSDTALRSILLVDYFGLCNLSSQIDLIHSLRPDIFIIIDAVQAFSSLTLSLERYIGADAVFTSPRKTLPVPDGGLVIIKENDDLTVPLITENSSERAALYLAAGTLRDGFVNGEFGELSAEIIEPLYLELYKRHGNLIETKVEAISTLSMEILSRIDLRTVANKRLSNFNWMQNSILEGRGHGIIRPALQNVMEPGLVYPVRVPFDHRTQLRAFLNKEGIYCPIHWPIPPQMKTILGDDSTRLSAELLSLPIDQRYDNSDLSRLLSTIEKYRELYKL